MVTCIVNPASAGERTASTLSSTRDRLASRFDEALDLLLLLFCISNIPSVADRARLPVSSARDGSNTVITSVEPDPGVMSFQPGDILLSWNSIRIGRPEHVEFLGAIVANLEVRFPIVWRFGGVLGWDAALVDAGRLTAIPTSRRLGKGMSTPEPIWESNPVVGLRFTMDTFVVRADLGFGDETTGFYLNFGHLF